jgi:hypothetical protein
MKILKHLDKLMQSYNFFTCLIIIIAFFILNNGSLVAMEICFFYSDEERKKNRFKVRENYGIVLITVFQKINE